MTEDKEKLSFQIIKNGPLFEEDIDIKKIKTIEDYEAHIKVDDALGHFSYAKTLFDLCVSNKPPMTIGLFGGWGLGKSSVINIFNDLVDITNNGKGKAIYFNAWKYSDDSFRRELLLTVADTILKDIDGNKEKEKNKEKIQTLYREPVLKQPDRYEIKSIRRFINFFKTDKIRLNKKEGTAFIVAGVLFIIFILLSISKKIDTTSTVAMTLTAAWFLHIFTERLPNLFQLTEVKQYDPKIIMPEQFTKTFDNLLDPLNKDLITRVGPPYYLIIDDFDRLSPKQIGGILTEVKTFLNNKHCFVIIAMDDKVVYEELGKKISGYCEEHLRKYFDVILKMAPLPETDLSTLSKYYATKHAIREDVVNIATTVGYDNARKLKHFINLYLTKYKTLRTRKLIKENDDAVHAKIAKIVALEDLYPEVIDKIVTGAIVYDQIEDDNALFDNNNIFNYDEVKHGKYRRFVESCDIYKIDDPYLYIYLKPTSELEEFSAIFKHLITREYQKAKDILSKINELKADKLWEACVTKIQHTAYTQRRNLIEGIFELIKDGRFVKCNKDNKIMSDFIRAVKIDGNRYKLLKLYPEQIKACFNKMGQMNWVLEEIIKAFGEETNYDENILKAIIYLYDGYNGISVERELTILQKMKAWLPNNYESITKHLFILTEKQILTINTEFANDLGQYLNKDKETDNNILGIMQNTYQNVEDTSTIMSLLEQKIIAILKNEIHEEEYLSIVKRAINLIIYYNVLFKVSPVNIKNIVEAIIAYYGKNNNIGFKADALKVMAVITYRTNNPTLKGFINQQLILLDNTLLDKYLLSVKKMGYNDILNEQLDVLIAQIKSKIEAPISIERFIYLFKNRNEFSINDKLIDLLCNRVIDDAEGVTSKWVDNVDYMIAQDDTYAKALYGFMSDYLEKGNDTILTKTHLDLIILIANKLGETECKNIANKMLALYLNNENVNVSIIEEHFEFIKTNLTNDYLESEIKASTIKMLNTVDDITGDNIVWLRLLKNSIMWDDKVWEELFKCIQSKLSKTKANKEVFLYGVELINYVDKTKSAWKGRNYRKDIGEILKNHLNDDDPEIVKAVAECIEKNENKLPRNIKSNKSNEINDGKEV